MSKRFLISVVVVFVMSMALGFTVHGVLLAQDYGQRSSLFRSPDDQQRHFPFMLVAHALTSLGLVWIYSRGREDKPPLAQGVRFGLAMAMVTVVPKFLIYWVVQPMPHVVALKQIGFDTIGIVLIGIVVAYLNK
jgi:Zn-dependent protease